MRRTAVLALALLVAACAGTPQSRTASTPVAPTVVRSDDPSRPTIRFIVTPNIVVGSNAAVVRTGAPYTITTLDATKPRTGSAVTVIASVLVIHRSGGWARFSDVRDANAQRLTSRSAEGDVTCAGYAVHPLLENDVVLPQAAVREVIAQGADAYRFKMFGNTMAAEIAIPVEHIKCCLRNQESGSGQRSPETAPHPCHCLAQPNQALPPVPQPAEPDTASPDRARPSPLSAPLALDGEPAEPRAPVTDSNLLACRIQERARRHHRQPQQPDRGADDRHGSHDRSAAEHARHDPGHAGPHPRRAAAAGRRDAGADGPDGGLGPMLFTL